MGTGAAYPTFQTLESGEITGQDIDVMNAVAEVAGLKVGWRNTGWAPLFTELEAGTVGIGFSSITITDLRKKTYDVTDSYFEANQLILVKEDSPVNLSN